MVENLRGNFFFYSHNTEGIFTYLSPSIENVLGYSQSEFLTHYSEYMTNNPNNKKVIRHTSLSIKGIKQPPYEENIKGRNDYDFFTRNTAERYRASDRQVIETGQIMEFEEKCEVCKKEIYIQRRKP